LDEMLGRIGLTVAEAEAERQRKASSDRAAQEARQAAEAGAGAEANATASGTAARTTHPAAGAARPRAEDATVHDDATGDG
jgi:hypothetical protein